MQWLGFMSEAEQHSTAGNVETSPDRSSGAQHTAGSHIKGAHTGLLPGNLVLDNGEQHHVLEDREEVCDTGVWGDTGLHGTRAKTKLDPNSLRHSFDRRSAGPASPSSIAGPLCSPRPPGSLSPRALSSPREWAASASASSPPPGGVRAATSGVRSPLASQWSGALSPSSVVSGRQPMNQFSGNVSPLQSPQGTRAGFWTGAPRASNNPCSPGTAVSPRSVAQQLRILAAVPPSERKITGSVISKEEGEGAGAGADVADPKSIQGYSKGVIAERLRAPRLTVRRLRQLCIWLNSLKVWPKDVTPESIPADLKSGLLLCRVLEQVIPEASFPPLNQKAVSKAASLHNLEAALRIIWKQAHINNTRVPSAEEIYQGGIHQGIVHQDKLHVLLNELMEVFALREARLRAQETLRWWDFILQQYDCALPADVLESPGPLLWRHFQSAVRVFCVVFHYHGPDRAVQGGGDIPVDSTRIFWRPRDLAEYRQNTREVFRLLGATGVPLMVPEEEWMACPDPDFVLLQLQAVKEAYEKLALTVRPFSSSEPGLTAGLGGRALIAGLAFADSNRRDASPGPARVVKMGDGTGMSVWAPPLVDGSPAFKGGRLPGLLCLPHPVAPVAPAWTPSAAPAKALFPSSKDSPLPRRALMLTEDAPSDQQGLGASAGRLSAIPPPPTKDPMPAPTMQSNSLRNSDSLPDMTAWSDADIVPTVDPGHGAQGSTLEGGAHLERAECVYPPPPPL